MGTYAFVSKETYNKFLLKNDYKIPIYVKIKDFLFTLNYSSDYSD